MPEYVAVEAGYHPQRVNDGCCAAPEDQVMKARRRHDAARNKHASSATALRRAREIVTHLEHDAYITEYELREANEELLRALRQG